MKCPIDQTQLVISERSGIEIDYCPQCRGVWLDRGELDKIIERADSYAAPREASRPAPAREGEYSDTNRYQSTQNHHTSHPKHHKKKRESFLSDLFEFGD